MDVGRGEGQECPGAQAGEALPAVSIPPSKFRRCGEDVAGTVGHQEVAVRDAGRRGVRADDDVDAEVVRPQVADIHPEQGTRLAEPVQDMSADGRVPPRLPLVIHVRLRVVSLFRRHRVLRDQGDQQRKNYAGNRDRGCTSGVPRRGTPV
jgi:hypothetical protein